MYCAPAQRCPAPPAPTQSVNPAPVSPAAGPHWQLLKQAILETLRPEGQGLNVVPILLA